MLVGVLDLPLIDMGFRANLCYGVLKISFVTQFANSCYEMYYEMGVPLIQMLY